MSQTWPGGMSGRLTLRSPAELLAVTWPGGMVFQRRVWACLQPLLTLRSPEVGCEPDMARGHVVPPLGRLTLRSPAGSY